MERKFDNQFMLGQIYNGLKKLKDDSILPKERKEITDMVIQFDRYLKNEEIREQNSVQVDKIDYKKLEEKLKHDLDILGISFWKDVQYLYNQIEHTTFNDKNYNNISISEDKMLNLILNFYENIDEEYYKKALQIIQFPKSLINFDEKSKNNNQYFQCRYLRLPFVNINFSGDLKFVAFVHEIQHGIDDLINNYKVFEFYRELAPMFFEVLFTDILNSMNNCYELYSFRINGHIKDLEILNNYVNILNCFDKMNKEINQQNIEFVLGINNKNKLIQVYNKIMNTNYLVYYCYVLSFFRCIELREEYYSNKKQTIIDLKNNVSGKNADIDLKKMVICYNNYINEVKEKQRDYQKNVNL